MSSFLKGTESAFVAKVYPICQNLLTTHLKIRILIGQFCIDHMKLHVVVLFALVQADSETYVRIN